MIAVASVGAILYAKGYRIDFSGKNNGRIIAGTGLLVATSKPDGARVLVNDHLTTATNNTINLAPGQYDVKIEKDGYLSWTKRITIKNGLVSEANALLFPTAPKLDAITTIGVRSVVMNPASNLLAYTVASNSATKNGVYVLNMNTGPFTFLGVGGTQLVNDVTDAFSQADISFSPDGKQILAKTSNSYYLLDVTNGNQAPRDVTNTLLTVNHDFEIQQAELDKKLNASLSKDLRPVASTYFSHTVPSPDADKLLYTASQSATLPFVLKKKVPSLNSTPDQRQIRKGDTYVYDIREDKNFRVFDVSTLTPLIAKPEEPQTQSKSPQFFWHADDRHLIFAESGKVRIMEYDGGNTTTAFEGPFYDSFVAPWPDGSSIAILLRFSSDVPYNLYRIGLQ